MTVNRTATTFIAFALSICCAATAAAQDDPGTPPPPEDPLARAFELNDEGFKAFDEGRYADAAKAFAAAWELSGDETLRKNEALAWFRADECDAAVEAGNKFLLVPDVSDTDRADIHSVIANCKVVFARTAIDAGDLDLADSLLAQAEGLDRADAVARDRIAAARVDLAAARRAAEDKEPLEPVIETVYLPQPDEKPPILGYGLIGGGGAVLVATLAYHLVALSWQGEFFDLRDGVEPGTQARFDSLRRRVHTAQVLVPIMYSVGVAAVGTGVAFAFVVPTLDETGALQPRIGLAARF